MSIRMMYRKRPLPPTADLLAEARRIYHYDGVNLLWKAHANPEHPGRGRLGSIVGGDDGHGYRMCAVLGHKFKVHQIIWLLHHEALSDLPLDHVNGDRRDNRIENLRQATDAQNGSNRRFNRAHVGVTKVHKCPGRYGAKIDVNGKRHHLGAFDSPEDAHAAYVEASRKLRGDFSPV